MISDTEFKQLLQELQRPWKGYRKVRKGVKKRLKKHMKELGHSSLMEYREFVASNPQHQEKYLSCLRVTISRFFRDRGVWENLGNHVAPRLISSFDEKLRIWSAGCSSGEEPYSLAILVNKSIFPPNTEILASDAEAKCLQRCKKGSYERSSLRELSEKERGAYFSYDESTGLYTILDHLKKNISWVEEDLFQPADRGGVHLLMLRNNILTYHMGVNRDSALDGILAHLVVGGFLVVGSHESLPERFQTSFEIKHPSIYKKIR